MIDDLMAFLQARLDEDEEIARAAQSEAWTVEPFVPSGPDALPAAAWVVAGPEGETGIATVNGSFRADHIARHDPARVLREVEAKRQIIADYEEHCELDDLPSLDHEREVNAYAKVLRWLALPYADHPDYRADWRV